ncbi:MAG: hypothetical protein HXN66_01855 [Prevotella pallens]|uniref:hypothetical protein n=1 Tax=Prevotella pallens TaxID=60133 RepID=UPI001CAE6E64|nr:hypothetical protein [Prevotella pallens]MBF1470151.1 hypothetical protein [Prevotella pallens]
MEIRKIALSLIAAMALGTTAVQAQCTNNCKKKTTTKAKIDTAVNHFEKDLKRDEAKVKTVAHKAGCAFKRDAKKVGAAVKRDEAKVKTAAHKAGCAFKRDAKKVGAAVKRDEVKVGKAVKKTYTKAKNALKKQK